MSQNYLTIINDKIEPFVVALYCIMRPNTEGRLDRYCKGIPRELAEIRTQPWLSEGSLATGMHIITIINNIHTFFSLFIKYVD